MDKKILREAIAHFGEKHQLIKVSEELSELSVEVCKMANGARHNVFEELADVTIMVDQLEMILDATVKEDGYTGRLVETIISTKTRRLAELIREEQTPLHG